MLEFSQQQRLALKVGDGFLVLRVVDVRLDHFFHGARRVAEIFILGKIDRAHAPTANPPDDFVTMIQNFAPSERFRFCPAWRRISRT